MPRRYRRSYRRRSPDQEMLLLAALLVAATLRVNEVWFITALYCVVLVLAAGLVTYSCRTWVGTRLRNRWSLLEDVDVMDGLEFEVYVADLLRRHGYRNVSLTERFDFGVDIVAERDGERWGVQTKRYAGNVGEYAVKQVVTGLKLYRCTRAMVITNSTYTSRAKTLGKSNDCVLVDRMELARLIGSVV